MKSLYEILDVAVDANDEEIKRAYKQMALKYHPDKSRTRNAEDRFKQIRRAYEVLADNKKRDLYDRLGTTEQEGSEMMDLSSARLDKSFSVSMEEINVSPKQQPPRAASKKRVGPRSEKLYASQQDLATTTRRRRAEQRDESSTTTKQPRKKSKSRTRRKSCDAVDGAASSKVIAKIKPQPAKVDPSHAKHQMEDVGEKVSTSALLRVGVSVLFGLAVLNLIKNLIYGIMLLVQLAINAAFIAILYFVLTGRVANIWQECQHFVGNFWTISSDLLMKIVQSLLRR